MWVLTVDSVTDEFVGNPGPTCSPGGRGGATTSEPRRENIGTDDRSGASQRTDEEGITVREVMVGVALALALVGCGGTVGPGAGTGTEVVETIEGVDYYYACGNEVLQLPDGRRFYPFAEQHAVDEEAYLGAPAPSAATASVVAATLAVPAPEPGDDTGTLTVYEDGTARFVSDSGTEAWLTEDEQTYNWEC